MGGPETQYAAVGESDVAYQILGNGPRDLLYVYGLGSHIEWYWESPGHVEFFRRLASFSRLILFDRRGTGASDGVPRGAIPTWEDWAEDVVAVLDAASCPQASLLGALDAGPATMLFAAMHPERVSDLVLWSTWARYMSADDYPIGASPEVTDSTIEMLRRVWGTREQAARVYPSRAQDAEFLRYYLRMVRSSATPRSAEAQLNYVMRSDIRQVLPLIQARTLVLTVTGNRLVPPTYGEYLAENIKGAELVEIPGSDLGMAGDTSLPAADAVAEFLTGERTSVEVERTLTTVLFTDVVGSTELAATQGDHRWSQLLDAHNNVVRSELHRFRGQEVDTAGDGFFATFDGPARAIRCACAIRDRIADLGLQVRAGLHTGEVELTDHGVRGLAVHIGARIGALAGPGQVLVSRTVADLVIGSGFDLRDQGEYQLKGVQGAWRLFSVDA